ncbi:hypothetical protein [Methylobacter sp. S3L5C]|uniref:hypothetical protein n=1 Tax=Methylobacter sp. S3L5C TaxID=2839024 RepID=UPI001FAE2BE6|nr:hypothetical protein [Methylobacter sp. S3L5C]UOA07812.1 hypothetical protein KKZ03_16365 [Methylobacter sp. S3L5C]
MIMEINGKKARKTRTVIMPRTKSCGLRKKAWWFLRKNKSVTLAELRQAICDQDKVTDRLNLGKWALSLTRAGLVARSRDPGGEKAGGRFYRYVLVIDVGPKAPVITHHDTRVFDPNSNQMITDKAELPMEI